MQQLKLYTKVGRAVQLAPARTGRVRAFKVYNAFKGPTVQPPIITPEEKTLQSVVETGIRGTIAMAAAYTLHLNLFMHMHLEPSHIVTGVEAALPCLAMEAVLLLASCSLPNSNNSSPVNSTTAAAAPEHIPSSSSLLTATVLQAAVDRVYLHTMRYSLIGAATGPRRMLLEAAAQLSDDLLARGVLLGCSTAWLASRLSEAGLCSEEPMLLSASAATDPIALCGTSIQWVAAAAICCMIAGRYNFHSKAQTTTLRDKKTAAAAEAAAQQKLLRYEPKVVQDKAAAAAAAATAGSSQSGELCSSICSQDEDHDEAVTTLVHGWLGARFVVGQAAMFAAFIATDNLLASFVAGLAMQMASNVCTEQYLKRST